MFDITALDDGSFFLIILHFFEVVLTRLHDCIIIFLSVATSIVCGNIV